MYATLKPLLDAAWLGVERPDEGRAGPPAVVWSWRITPPFPAAWPPDGSARAVLYAYAEGFDLGLADAVRVAAPWAIVEAALPPGGNPAVARLPGDWSELGIQGVRPLSPEEMPQRPPSEGAEAFLARTFSSPAAAQEARGGLCGHYGFWARHNGVIARAVRPRHPAFFKWLGV